MIINMLAGAVSGGMARLMVAPLDVVKIRFQVQVDPNVVPTLPTIGFRPNYHYKSIFNAFSTIYKQEGVKALWRGNLLAELMWMSFAAVQFSTFNLYKFATKQFLPSEGTKYKLDSLVSGGLAGMTATMIVYPLDLLRTRFAAQSLPMIHPTITSAVKTIYANQGIYGFYYGICPSLWQLIPYASMQFFIYDSLKLKISRLSNHNLAPFIAGFVAGCFSKLMVLPFDVVKKRLQIHGLNMYRENQKNTQNLRLMRCPSFFGTIHDIYKFEGPSSFFKGAVPSILKASIQTAVVFTLFENSKAFLTSLAK
uniref:ADP,ATP carrier protein n=1 Tax=Arcella intermedia TaxID=1963864 RepID=A0A6B2LAU1_9EUKA